METATIMGKHRRITDDLLKGAIYLSAFLAVGLLAGIILYVFYRGIRTVTPHFLLSVQSPSKGNMGIAGKMKEMNLDSEDAQNALAKNEAIIFSMTPKERENPHILNPSRKKRIAQGAGVDIAVVNRLVKQFEEAKKAMKNMPGMFKGGKKGKFKLPF